MITKRLIVVAFFGVGATVQLVYAGKAEDWFYLILGVIWLVLALLWAFLDGQWRVLQHWKDSLAAYQKAIEEARGRRD